MVLPTGELPFSVTFERADGALSATMDIPAQSVLDLLLTAVSYADGRVHFELHAPIGLAVWDGAHEGDTIEGEFTQGAARGTFSVERAAVVEPESDEPIPYREKEVRGHRAGRRRERGADRVDRRLPAPAVRGHGGERGSGALPRGTRGRDEDR